MIYLFIYPDHISGFPRADPKPRHYSREPVFREDIKKLRARSNILLEASSPEPPWSLLPRIRTHTVSFHIFASPCHLRSTGFAWREIPFHYYFVHQTVKETLSPPPVAKACNLAHPARFTCAFTCVMWLFLAHRASNLTKDV